MESEGVAGAISLKVHKVLFSFTLCSNCLNSVLVLLSYNA